MAECKKAGIELDPSVLSSLHLHCGDADSIGTSSACWGKEGVEGLGLKKSTPAALINKENHACVPSVYTWLSAANGSVRLSMAADLLESKETFASICR